MSRTITLNANEVEAAMHDTLAQIVNAAHQVLSVIQPELAADIIDRGVVLTGGGALLRGMDKLISGHLGVVASESIRVAGDKMNADIAGYVKREHGLQIGERTAEQIKIKIGTATPLDDPEEMEVRGRDNFTGMPSTNITEIERKAIIGAAEKSGGGKVYLEYEPKVAAIGAGLDIFSPIASMVIDMGGGTSDIAVLSLGDETDKVLAVGTEAYQMVGRTPGNIRAVRPLKDGVISDFDMTEAMLSYFMAKLNAKGVMSRPNIMVCAWQMTSVFVVYYYRYVKECKRACSVKN
ncbi:rod shape-determining protein [Weissella confusa]|uniref:Rod shape-determining protein n=1 Tax=Weissella confusa TaxID=1583 RepID=A0A923NFT7_WEICO|nr:rod shape-determining protein [Weissella confusa]